MAISIRNNDNIKGFKCRDREIKTSLYADDTTLLLNDIESIVHAINTVHEFSEVAGPILNKEKTEGIVLGTLHNTLQEFMAVRALGIYIGHDQQTCINENWTEKIEKMRMVFERWKSRKLTIFGKILIIKSISTSKIIHTMSILSTPESVLKQVNFNFIWDANDRIKRRTLIGDKNHGGVKMLDIYCKNKALKASWINMLQFK